jgi:hypothetical protein
VPDQAPPDGPGVEAVAVGDGAWAGVRLGVAEGEPGAGLGATGERLGRGDVVSGSGLGRPGEGDGGGLYPAIDSGGRTSRYVTSVIANTKAMITVDQRMRRRMRVRIGWRVGSSSGRSAVTRSPQVRRCRGWSIP